MTPADKSFVEQVSSSISKDGEITYCWYSEICPDDIKRLLTIISRLDRALEKAKEQRDEEVRDTDGFSWSSVIDPYNQELQDILEGKEE